MFLFPFIVCLHILFNFYAIYPLGHQYYVINTLLLLLLTINKYMYALSRQARIVAFIAPQLYTAYNTTDCNYHLRNMFPFVMQKCNHLQLHLAVIVAETI